MPVALRNDFIGLDEYERLCEAAEEGERLEYIDYPIIFTHSAEALYRPAFLLSRI